MNRVELIVRRRLLKAFIDAQPVDITLVRRVRVETPAGGWTLEEPAEVPPQRFRLVPFKRRLTHQTEDNQDGSFPRLPYVLVGNWNADVQREDEFDMNGHRYRVVDLEPNSHDRTQNDRITVELELR